MFGSVRMREMRRSDFAAVLRLWQQLTNQGEVEQYDFDDFIFSSIGFRNTIVLEKNSSIIGVGSIYFLPKLKGLVGQIEDVVIDDSYRKGGYGIKLINKLVDIARDKECYKVILNCTDDNIKFYKKAGFKCQENQMRLNLR